MLVRIQRAEKTVSTLSDTGVSADGVVENAKRSGIDLGEVEYIALSHGHFDHSGGLVLALKAINKPDLPLILHKDMFKKRGSASKDGAVRAYPEFPTEKQLSTTRIIKTNQPCLIAEKMILVTGEIPRETSFEKGFLHHKTQKLMELGSLTH
jgi:7,8-dihydropterin-6-yl-methyl-4-(beta-D-ribofuranosyl)aminobenzene 5'-phosphate synthase